MHAVVSLFDGKNKTLRSLLEMLEGALGKPLYESIPSPHLSYQGATKYDFDRLEDRIQAFAKRTHGFRIRAGGLGIFTGLTPTLYIPVVRTQELSRFQRALWTGTNSTGSGLNPLYQPEVWVPHITLARGMRPQTLTRVVGRISRFEVGLDVRVANLAIIEFDGKSHTLRSKIQLAGD